MSAVFYTPTRIGSATSVLSSIRGFTMIELMIAISVAAILLALAVPSFTSIINSNRVSAQANELLATMQSAKLDSIRHGTRTVVCASDNADSATPSCGSTSAWAGWIAFVDSDKDGAYDAAEKLIKAHALQGIKASASTNVGSKIMFRPDGLARKSGGEILQGKIGLCIETTNPAVNTRDISFGLGGGRVSVEKRNAGATCSAPEN